MTSDLNTTFGHRSIYTLRRFYSIMRRTIPAHPLEPIEPAEPLSYVIKGQHAPRANPESSLSILSTPAKDATLC